MCVFSFTRALGFPSDVKLITNIKFTHALVFFAYSNLECSGVLCQSLVMQNNGLFLMNLNLYLQAKSVNVNLVNKYLEIFLS